MGECAPCRWHLFILDALSRSGHTDIGGGSHAGVGLHWLTWAWAADIVEQEAQGGDWIMATLRRCFPPAFIILSWESHSMTTAGLTMTDTDKKV